MKYKFLGAYAWCKEFEKEFQTDEEAIEHTHAPYLQDGRWFATVWKEVNGEWLMWDQEKKQWILE